MPIKTTKVALAIGLAAAFAGLGVGQFKLQQQANAAAAKAINAPAFQVDPFWPKPLPNHWLLGNVIGVAVDGRDEGDTRGRNDKGLVTYDRRTKKDAFFWYKANWSSDPVVYVTSRRFTPRTTATVTVKVYSNLDSVTLSVNGTSRGAATGADRIFTWTNVPLVVGANTVEATGMSGGAAVTDRVTWTRQ